MSTRPPRRAARVAAAGAPAVPEASITTSAPSPPVASRMAASSVPAARVDHRRRAQRARGRQSVLVDVERDERRAPRAAAAAATMKAPMPPTPMTAHDWPRRQAAAPHGVQGHRQRLGDGGGVVGERVGDRRGRSPPAS